MASYSSSTAPSPPAAPTEQRPRRQRRQPRQLRQRRRLRLEQRQQRGQVRLGRLAHLLERAHQRRALAALALHLEQLRQRQALDEQVDLRAQLRELLGVDDARRGHQRRDGLQRGLERAAHAPVLVQALVRHLRQQRRGQLREVALLRQRGVHVQLAAQLLAHRPRLLCARQQRRAQLVEARLRGARLLVAQRLEAHEQRPGGRGGQRAVLGVERRQLAQQHHARLLVPLALRRAQRLELVAAALRVDEAAAVDGVVEDAQRALVPQLAPRLLAQQPRGAAVDVDRHVALGEARRQVRVRAAVADEHEVERVHLHLHQPLDLRRQRVGDGHHGVGELAQRGADELAALHLEALEVVAEELDGGGAARALRGAQLPLLQHEAVLRLLAQDVVVVEHGEDAGEVAVHLAQQLLHRLARRQHALLQLLAHLLEAAVEALGRGVVPHAPVVGLVLQLLEVVHGRRVAQPHVLVVQRQRLALHRVALQLLVRPLGHAELRQVHGHVVAQLVLLRHGELHVLLPQLHLLRLRPRLRQRGQQTLLRRERAAQVRHPSSCRERAADP